MCITENHKLQITFKSVEVKLGYDDKKVEEKIDFNFNNPTMNNTSTSSPEVVIIAFEYVNLVNITGYICIQATNLDLKVGIICLTILLLISMTIAMIYYVKNRKRNLSSEPKSDLEDTKLDHEKILEEELSNQEESPEFNPMMIPRNFQIQNNQ